MSGNGSGGVSDWISAVSSVAAAIVGLMTLVTVYTGAIQILSQNRMYKLGLSPESLGPWTAKVAQSTLLGFQWRISTPSVSLKSLVKNKWQPNIVFPVGFPRRGCVERGDNVMAKASWVNFMQGLGLSPTDDTFYEMWGVSGLVNCIVPMRWTGQDLVGICSILGFQSFEKEPSFKSPMILPMQWSGPLGWVQFRSSENGCVAEFRNRIDLYNQIPLDFHKYYNDWSSDLPREPYYLESRLWNSINGLYLKEGGGTSLYLGGAIKCNVDQDPGDEEDIPQDQVLDDLMSADLPNEDILRMLFGRRKDRPAALQREFERARGGGRPFAGKRREDDTDDFLNSMLRDTMESSNKKQVFLPCPGLLSVSFHGELAHNRGLSIKDSKEYRRIYIDNKDVDKIRYPYKLGDLYMDKKLLKYVKEAILLLRPDGFYFSPTPRLYGDLCEAYQHIEDQIKKKIFAIDDKPRAQGSKVPNGSPTVPPLTGKYAYLDYGMRLCNELQVTRKTAKACFSVDDMRLFSKAACALKEILSPTGRSDGEGLVWAMLYCTDLSTNVRRWFEAAGNDKEAFFSAKITSKHGQLDCASLLSLADPAEQEKLTLKTATTFTVPLLDDGEFTGAQILAALTIVFITYFWISKKWITDVAADMLRDCRK
ncbi:uncharacterized protein F4812DRAFT_456127 [Daldinia caldariorum]|uniref:uncharacterized protein n=1 Tax=Daldinia caldariorum TaxID=326644 RepID=UPI0020082143|nr:uncharacterized protein F4812DRAFT_456127 [Daldinia caldariorum]KAI1472029.1 hypothetical protein F4812DRAFT_456127 [Daldinia caldariorum]